MYGDLFTPFNFSHCVCDVTNPEDPVQFQRYENFVNEEVKNLDQKLCSVKLFNSEMSRRSMNYDTALATISRNVFARTKARPRFASLWYV